jgi:23S rRNA (cytidine1920-2'-O)/16S rRNA (cytidine1409-2'-O)-methyltransferase
LRKQKLSWANNPLDKTNSKNKTRLDQLLLKKGLAESRQKAKAMIMAGEVMVDGVRQDKPGHTFYESSEITLKTAPIPYVSRGGLKLEAAINNFKIDVNNLVMLDIGASTGGFTDCLLQKGAKKVFAVDVGYGQLHWKLRQDPRVIIFEKTNARYLTPEHINEPVEGAVIDVSFISLKLIIPVITQLLPDNSFIVALIKPQFEAGKGQAGKGGVIKDPDLHRSIINDIREFCVNTGWKVEGCIPSPILGPKGNQEFLIYLKGRTIPFP